MLRLITFGGLALQRDGVPEVGEAAQRRKLALLAVLAAAGTTGVPRDRLLLLFWPDSTQEHARNSLKQLIFSVRHSLDEEIIAGTSLLALNSARITSDVGEFVAAVQRRDAAGVVAAYAGPFLDGVHVSDAPEFDEWASRERARHERAYAQALEQLATAATAAGDHPEAVRHWQARAAIAPLDTRVELELLAAMVAAGDRAGALRHAAAHEQGLRSELGLEPDQQFREFVAQIGRATPRSSAAIPPMPSPPAPAEPPIIPPRESRWPVAAPWLAAAAIVILLIAWSAHEVGGRTSYGDVGVLPFETAGADASLAYLRLGMQGLLVRELAADSAAPVAVDTASLQAIARRTHAKGIIAGSVIGHPQHFVLRALLIDTRSGRALADVSVPATEDSLAAASSRLVAELLALNDGVPANRAAVIAQYPLPAVREYLAGERSTDQQRLEAATAHYQAALAYDSTFAYAALGLISVSPGDPAGVRGTLPHALALAWAARDRLTDNDRVYLQAVVGRRYPRPSSLKMDLEAWQAASRAAPERPDVWFGLGDAYYHDGYVLGLANPAASARVALEHALERDSSNGNTLMHLVDLAARAGDTAAVRSLTLRTLQLDSTGPLASYVRWRASVALHDSAAHRRMLIAIDTMAPLALRWIVQAALDAGTGMTDGVHAAASPAWSRASIGEQIEQELALYAVSLARGRASDATAAAARISTLEPDDYLDFRFPILAALYGAGDSASAESAVQTMDRHYRFEAHTGVWDDGALEALCVAAQWRAHDRDEAFVRMAIDVIRHNQTTAYRGEMAFCTNYLTATLTAATPAVRRASAAMIDSLVSAGEPIQRAFPYAAIAGARLWMSVGQPAPAMALVRRQGFFGRWPYYRATALSDEVRYALAAGNAPDAWCAFEQLQTLRLDPEPQIAAADRQLGAAVRAANPVVPACAAR